MRGGIVLCVPVSPVEATCRGRLLHGEVQVLLVLLVLRRPSVCILFVWSPDRWLFVMVTLFCGGRGDLKHPDLYLQGTMSSGLGWQVAASARVTSMCAGSA